MGGGLILRELRFKSCDSSSAKLRFHIEREQQRLPNCPHYCVSIFLVHSLLAYRTRFGTITSKGSSTGRRCDLHLPERELLSSLSHTLHTIHPTSSTPRCLCSSPCFCRCIFYPPSVGAGSVDPIITVVTEVWTQFIVAVDL